MSHFVVNSKKTSLKPRHKKISLNLDELELFYFVLQAEAQLEARVRHLEYSDQLILWKHAAKPKD